MQMLMRDERRAAALSGLGMAVVSAMAFGVSGAVARGLLDTGWSPAAIVVVRVGLGALLLSLPAARLLRGRWHLLAGHAPLILAYAVLAVAVVQLGFFTAVRTIPVGVALLIEYTGPVLVVAWVWAVHGRRPGALTWLGGAGALAGLTLVLDLGGVGPLDVGGALWALSAAVGLAAYFIMSADSSPALPPVVLAASGLAVGTVLLVLAGLSGFVSLEVGRSSAVYGDVSLPAWVALGALGLVCGALAYATGIAASRRMGSRVASFVAMSEVLFAMLFAWLLLDELPRPVQLLGGLVVLAGVIVLRVGQLREAGLSDAAAQEAALPDTAAGATPPPAPRAARRARRAASRR